ncbi:DUF6639 family protein [Primorskyibacter sp. 2E233]|uniref:DUF6639 family protein n=1 Tax=Primorskyibacter sp. 2E233 TaxID=3413431 RepID=UPI003BF41EAF
MHRIIVSTVSLWASALGAETFVCDNNIVKVETASPDLAQTVCTHTDTALAQFRSCNLPDPFPLGIEAVNSLENNCLGLFHCGENRIEVLAPDAMTALRLKQSLFNAIPTDRLFASVILHEMAHALYDQTPCPFDDCVATSEYFAYTQQLSGLLPQDLATIENQIDPEHEVSRDSINAMILLMAPDRFTLNAWEHFSQLEDSCSYWRGILHGQIVFDRVHP